MAQKSMYFFNRSGYYMFWNSMWDNKINFSKVLQFNFFIKSFITFFFDDYFFKRFYIKYNYFDKNISLIDYYNLNNLNNSKKIIDFFKSNKNNIFISKIWFFKYQKWIVLYLCFFNKKNLFNYKNNHDIKKVKINLILKKFVEKNNNIFKNFYIFNKFNF